MDETPELPSYLQAADNHNLGNQKNSWFDLGAAADSISRMPEFMAVSALSGLNSFYNTGVKVGNFLGGDFTEQKTAALISGIDSDLGTYYRQNQESADLMGFVLGSFIPGVAGVKILNAGQKALVKANEGIIGTNLGLALGLRATKIDAYIASAADEITKGQALFATLGSSGTKALASGVYQNVLEGIAFETAVQATMQASPILSGQDKGDIIWNIGMGGLLGGAIGGAISSAQSYGKIRSLVTGIKKETQASGSRDIPVEMNEPANRIIRLKYDEYSIADELNPGDPLYAQKVEALKQRQVRIEQDSRATVGKLTGADTDLHRMVADINVGSDPEEVMGRMLHTDQITRVTKSTSVESEVNKAVRAQEPVPGNLAVNYWKLTGEEAGTVLKDAPKVLSLADTEGSVDGVKAWIKKQNFKPGQLWDATSQGIGERAHKLAEARYIWAQDLKELPEKNLTAHMNDIPLLQRAAVDGRIDIRLVDDTGAVRRQGFSSLKELQDYTIDVQKAAASTIQEKALKEISTLPVQEREAARDWFNQRIGKITNTRVGALEGTALTDPALDYNAMAAAQLTHNQSLTARGLKAIADENNDIRFLPQWAKVTKRIRDFKAVDGTVVDAMSWIASLEKQTKAAVDRAVAKNAGEFFSQFPAITKQDLANTSPQGVGAGALKFSNPGYADPGTKFAFIGSITQRWSQSAKELFGKTIAGDAVALGRNQEAVIEWGGIQQKMSRSAKQWYKSDELVDEELNLRGLVSKEIVGKEGALAEKYAGYTEADLIKEGLYLPVAKDETWNFIASHQAQTSRITQASNERAAAVGKALSYDANVVRPIPPDPRDLKFFAFVKDPKVTSQGHTSMIFAENAPKLEELVKKAQQARPDLEVYFKQDAEEFRRARQTYDYDRTLSENSIDSALKNEGIYSDYFIKTDPQKVLDEFMNYHTKKIDIDVRESVRAKYRTEFDWLEDQAKAYSRVETSAFGGNFSKLEQSGKNPYLSYIKTALNVSRMGENPIWQGFNKSLDEAVSTAVGKIQDIWGTVKPGASLSEADLNNINGALQKYGLNTGYYDAATTLLVNHTAPKNELSKFVRGANTVLARFTLGTDPLNGLVNAIGANVLRGTEGNQLFRAITEGDKELAGKLGAINVTEAGDQILSPAKNIAACITDYFKAVMAKEGTPEATLLKFHKDNGFIRSISDQFRTVLDNVALAGAENPQALQSRFSKIVEASKELSEKAETWTGNKHMEEMNRFVTARFMQRYTDVAISQGKMDAQEALAYINTFVNRVEGNVIASQRPFVFQGAVGQALGLFQSYQFNLMQQLFRYVSEGSGKDAAMLLGLQGTFYGIQGLPAFQAINQHVIGTASGNTRHIDAYDATYGIAGKNLGDLLTYGIPSILLQTNLYSRGDINPRQITIIPTALNEVPVVGATMKFFGSLKDTATRIAAGGAVWETLLQGIEHNGISRPLAGLAQTLQATAVGAPMSTSGKGDILFTNDLVSLASLSRLAGGRPLDEAIVNDGVFRIHSYQTYDHNRMNALTAAIKSNAQTGADIDYGAFAAEYAARGGRQVQFNKYMVDKIKGAGVSQSEKIISQLQNPFAQKVQVLMGGDLSSLDN